MKKNLIKVLIACFVVSGVVTGGYFGYQKFFGGKTVATNTAYTTMTAKKMNLEVKVQGTGSVFAAITKDLTVSSNGIVNDLNLNIGDAVEKDAVLCSVYSEQIEESIANAQANLDKQKLQISNSTIDQEIKLQQMVVNDAQSDLNSILEQQSKMTLKSPIEGTVKEVTTTNGDNVNTGKAIISIEGKDSIVKEVIAVNSGIIKNLKVKAGDNVIKDSIICTVYSEQIDKQVSSAKTNLEKQKLQFNKLLNESEPSLMNASVIEAQKQLNKVIAEKDSLTLKAPFSGIITAKNNKNGESAQAGKTVLSIVDTSSYKIKVTVDELDIAKLKLGQKAEITFGGLKDQVFQGAVEQISKIGNASNNVTTFDVIVSIDNPENVYLGMNANVNILTESKNDALVIPAEALIEQNGKKYVMVADSRTDGAAAVSVQGKSNDQSNTKVSTQGSNSGQASQNAYTSGQGAANRQARSNGGNFQGATGRSGMSVAGRLIEIKIGLENENYIEVLEGITEGQKLIVQLPQSTTQNNNSKQGLNGSFGGNTNFGGNRPQMQPSGGKGN